MQIALERALQRSSQWQPGTRLDSWVFGIVRNAYIDELRSRQRRSQIFAPAEAGENVGSVDSDDEILAVEAALALLPEEQRSAVSLVLIEGLSYKEAAAAMDVPIGTLTSRLARARDSLQAILSGTAGVSA